MHIFKELKNQGFKSFFKNYFMKNRTEKQTIVKNFSWLFVGKTVSGTVGFLLMIFIARYLGVFHYGQFSFALAFTALFAATIGDGEMYLEKL